MVSGEGERFLRVVTVMKMNAVVNLMLLYILGHTSEAWNNSSTTRF